MNAPRFENVYELSPMQQGILFHTLLDPAGDLYFEQCVVTIRGALDPERFARAWDRVVQRHSILRTSFHWEGLEKPVQVVHPQVALPFESFDWADRSPEAQRSGLESFLEGDRRRSFDLASPPLVRVTLFRMGAELHECVLTFQHLLLDRWSRFLVLRDVFEAYADEGFGNRPSIAPPAYSEYIAWVQRQDRARAEEFWRRSLAGFETPTPLGSAPGPAASNGPGENAALRMSEEDTERIQAFARLHRLTVNTLVQGAWAILLSRYGGSDDVLFGATVSGRPPALADVESMVGLFINSLPVRLQVDPEARVLPWLRDLQARLLELRDYEHSSLIDIQGWSEIPRGVPLFDSLVVFENVGGDSGSPAAAGFPEIAGVRSVGGATNYPLTLLANPGRELSLRIQADGSLVRSESFGPGAAARILGHYRTLLERLVADPQQTVGELSLLTEAERERVVYEWNRTDRDYPAGSTIADLFEEQVARTPDSDALVSGRERLTYAGLNERSNRLAAHLRRRGVGPEVLVGLCVERSIEMVVGLLAILKAGGAYVPLDPAYPGPRLAFMLEDSGASLVITSESVSDSLPPLPVPFLLIDADWPAVELESGENPERASTPQSLAYVIYTSGSTGIPKGVAIENHSAVALIAWAGELYSEGGLNGTLASTSISFDLSVFELFAPLAAGGKVVIARDVLELPQLAAAGEVTLVNTVPSAMAELVRSAKLPDSVRTVNLAGEPLPTALVAEILSGGGVRRVFDLYGPSEDTTYSTCAPRTRDGPATIGRPIANKRAYILDARLQPVPIGLPGDLYVAGAGVARGYLNRPEMTAERFLEDPFRPGDRMYRTGDRARFRPDGNIQFLGRLDNQVKVRGYRIEIGEIERALSRHPGLRACAVIAAGDGADKKLIGYVVPREDVGPGPSVSASDLRAFLRDTLPGYMIPSLFVFLEALPMTPNGKLDRRALPAPDGVRAEGAGSTAPQTAVEREIEGIWKEILGIERAGLDDNFFELGGHSLLATRLVSRIAESLNVRVPLREVFEQPTLGGLAAWVAGAMASVETPADLLRMLAEVQGLSDAEARDRLVLEGQSDAEGAPPVRS